MDCFLLTCKKNSHERIMCDKCGIPRYCSDECRRIDASSHESWCRPRMYSIKDFTPVKTSNKILEVGPYGEVQLVQHTGNGKLYVMKTVKKHMAADIIPLKVLYKEVLIHRTLVHPNIVRLIDHFEDTSKLYLILEYVEKGSLFDLIRRKIKLPETEACEIFVQTCSALNYMHENDIIHRDIKPENLLISKDDIVKICDFGWSAQSSENRVTFCGTLDYMSPEMLNSEAHSPKMDIWALGILLYEMLHGAPPYRGKNPKEQHKLISLGNLIIGPHVSHSASQLIRSILQLQAQARPSILDILKSQWVQEFSDVKLQNNWHVSSPKFGEGTIVSVIGKVSIMSFRSKRVTMIECEVLRKCVIYDNTNILMHTPPDEESDLPIFDPDNANIPFTPLYKKLGIDSGRATPISTGQNSAKNSRRGSFVSGPLLSPPSPTFKISQSISPPEVSPVFKELRPPRCPKFEDNVSKSMQYLRPRKKIQKDFVDIALSPEIIPYSQPISSARPKSSFLAKFNQKNN